MSNELDVKVQDLKDEIKKLQYEFKVDLPKRISEARAYGDLKENAEYHAARERQSFVKARISQLSEQLSQLTSINLNNIADDRIAFGSLVHLIDLDSKDRVQFSFVSSNEVKPSEGKISLSSPIGLALHNKVPGDSVEITIPAGKKKYYIEKLTTIHGTILEKAYEG